MLVTLNDVMMIAEQQGIAIGAFNTPNLEALRAAIESAEELERPVIVQHCQMHEELIPLDIIGPIMHGSCSKGICSGMCTSGSWRGSGLSETRIGYGIYFGNV